MNENVQGNLLFYALSSPITEEEVTWKHAQIKMNPQTTKMPVGISRPRQKEAATNFHRCGERQSAAEGSTTASRVGKARGGALMK